MYERSLSAEYLKCSWTLWRKQKKKNSEVVQGTQESWRGDIVDRIWLFCHILYCLMSVLPYCYWNVLIFLTVFKTKLTKAVIKRFIGTWKCWDCILPAFISGYVPLLTLHIYEVLSSLGQFMDYPHAYTRTNCRQHLSLMSAWITCMLHFLLASHFLSFCLSYLGKTFCNIQKPLPSLNY